MTFKSSKRPGMPKGRQTIRKGGSLTGLHGAASRRIKLWEFEPAPGTLLAQLEQSYFTGLQCVDRAEERTRTNVASGKFTPEGVKDDLLKFVLSDLVPVLHKAGQTIKKARDELAERRSRLKVEGPDPSDIAAAFRRMEIRTFLRDMKSEDQANYFANYGNNLPGEVAQAVLELPPEYSGVPKSRHDLLTANALQAQHGSEMGAIAELEEAIAAAESAVEAGRNEVRLEAGVLDERKFNELAAPVEAKHDAPWLRRRKDAAGSEEIRVVDLDRRIERLATPQEIERGIYYRDYDHFMEGKAP
jgi:hypothetical protein